MSQDPDTLPPSRDGLPAELIDRYWRGETTPLEAAQVEAWFDTNPGARMRYEQAGEVLKTETAPDRTPEAWVRLEAAVLTSLNPTTGTESPKIYRISRGHTTSRSDRSVFRAIAMGGLAAVMI